MRRLRRPGAGALAQALWDTWDDPPSFREAFDLHLRRHDEHCGKVRRMLSRRGEEIALSTLRAWRQGRALPRGAAELAFLHALERRYALPTGYFQAKLGGEAPCPPAPPTVALAGAKVAPVRRRRSRGPRPVAAFPKPLWTTWVDPPDFASALDLHIRRHGDTGYGLAKIMGGPTETIASSTFYVWRRAEHAPRSSKCLRILAALEQRYGLPAGYFAAKLPHPGRMKTNAKILARSVSERRRLAWHLPDNFDQLPRARRDEIVEWVETVIISGATDYRRYQAEAMKQRYAVQFGDVANRISFAGLSEDTPLSERLGDPGAIETGRRAGPIKAPIAFSREAADLYDFKTATLSSRGRRRNGIWNNETAAQKMEHFGLLFGALTASPDSSVKGYGAPLRSLCFALLAFPAVWDWYLQWREARRGFYTQWETEMLTVVAGFTRAQTGWLRQTPQLAHRLRPIAGLVTPADVQAAHDDWEGVCETLHRHAILRAKEIARVSRVHRDPFEPILSILETESPLGEYRKITEEILRRRPDARLYPLSAAEATRAFLMLRLGLHLGLRQKNLRQLLVKPRGHAPSSERQLEAIKRGELRWNLRDAVWEVLVPAAAFKNAGSSYFRKNPFRLALPDLGDLYQEIDDWLSTHRAVLLRGARDPGTFFVKTVKARSKDAAYNQTTFYEAWRLAIQRYGIFNPYTGHGAIKGLLPHGPHNVRDVLATHVLKKTGSYEQASYAIQDTPDTIAQHYGRFLPQDKAALAAAVLNKAWSD